MGGALGDSRNPTGSAGALIERDHATSVLAFTARRPAGGGGEVGSIYLDPSWTQISTGENVRFQNWLVQKRLLVGARRFELLTPCAQGRCATRLRYAPTGPIINETVQGPRTSVIVCHRQHGMIRAADPLTSVRQSARRCYSFSGNDKITRTPLLRTYPCNR